MRVEILLILVVAALTNSSFKRYKDYQQYLNQWKNVVPQKYIHNVTDIANDRQLCYDKKCQFFYYQSQDKTVTDPIRQKVVLLVSGMHGNQFLGPHTLLYAYKHLKAYKIIYFPMANPSGFNKQTRQTFPDKIDPNRDFPIDGNTHCYQASATHILDMLFRKYKFDLTVILHNGGTQIGFNWGTNKHISNSHTEEYNIYIDIAEMMQQAGGYSSQLSLQKFPIGTMVETIYAAQGTFDDWAYAAGKFPDLMNKCDSFDYKPYPSNMANGLAFLIEMGPFITDQLGSEQGIYLPPSSNNKYNGHIARVIRILKTMMDILNPRLSFYFLNNTAFLQVKGCKQAKIQKLLLYTQNNQSWLTLFQQNSPIYVAKNKINKEKIQLAETIQQNTLIRFSGSLYCDSEWVGKGKTQFAKPRLFQVQVIEKSNVHKEQPQYLLTQFYDIAVEWKFYIVIAVLFFLLLVFCIFWRCSKKQKIQKFQQVQFVGQSRNGDNLETQQQMGGDLHTARGGIINM